MVSPYYLDPYKNIPRELDIVAEKALPVGFDRFIGNVHVGLFIECKHELPETVFWFDKRDGQASKELLARMFGTVPSFFKDIDHRFLLNPEVAKLFHPGGEKGFYKALNEVLNSYESLSTKPFFIKDTGEKHFPVIDYKIILLKQPGNIFRYTPKTLEPIQDSYIQFETIYQGTYHLIEMLEFDSFQNYLSFLIQDVEIVKDVLQHT